MNKVPYCMRGNEDRTEVGSAVGSNRSEKANSRIVVKNVKRDEW